MHLLVWLYFIVFSLNAKNAISFIIPQSGCSIDIQSQLGQPQPLLLDAIILRSNKSSLDYESFLWPLADGYVYLKNDKEVLIACPGGFLIVSGQGTDFTNAVVTCREGNFMLHEEPITFNEIQCSKLPSNTARFTGKSCLNDKREIEVGFELNIGKPDQFIRLLTICFDDNNYSTLYSSATLSKHLVGAQSRFPRPNFVQDGFYPFGVTSKYARESQRATINKLLDLPASSRKYISETDDLFISKGHLIAKVDFVYASQQKATFHYVNAAPQWQTLNGRNWNALETKMRRYVAGMDSYDERFTLIAGTHGVSTLPHEKTGEEIELYLQAEDTSRGLPVPQLYWRILRNERTKQAVAFIGVNNPYRNGTSADIICQDICSQILWLKWDAHNSKNGFSYCCSVDDLRQTVSNVPQFEVTGLLTTKDSN